MEFTTLTSDDYYRFNAPFRQWLFDSKGKQLGDFKTENARKIFTNEFIISWNKSELSSIKKVTLCLLINSALFLNYHINIYLEEYYINGPNMRTNFVKKEKIIIKGNEKISTAKNEKFGFTDQEASRLFSHSLPKTKYEPFTETTNKHSTTPRDRAYLKRKADDLEELAPKKEGHAKVVENRRLKSSHTRHDKNSTNDIELSDDILFSNSISSSLSSTSNRSIDPNYHQLLNQERELVARKDRERLQRKNEKENELKLKMEKYNQRESEVQEILKKMINKK